MAQNNTSQKKVFAKKPSALRALQTTKNAVWDLKDILNKKTPEAVLAQVKKDVATFKEGRKALVATINATKLLELITLKEKIAIALYRISGYYELQFYEDTKNTQALAQMGYLKQLGTAIDNDMLFFSLWFMRIDEKNAQRLITSKELAPYKHYLEKIRSYAPYTKSEETEQIINLIGMTGGGAFAEVYNILTNSYEFMINGKKMTKEEAVALFRSNNPKLREESYTQIFTKYGIESVALAEIYKNIVLDWHNEDIKVRGYKSAISVRNHSNDIDDRMVETLLQVVRKNAGVFATYFKLKHAYITKNMKAKDKYPYSRFHLYAPAGLSTEKKYTYTQSKQITIDTYNQFDKRFGLIAQKIFDANHVHSHPGPTKRSGAFCYDMPTGTLPYILLNHTDNLRDVFTMMHEFGHGIHMTLSQKQKDLIQHASIPLSETASTFGEMILADKLLRESKDVKEKIMILMNLLDNQYATIDRQAYFVIFEKYAHEHITGELTKDALDAYYLTLLKEQFGDMIIPELFKHEWNYIPHLHETPFYCYAYAWGNLFVLALFQKYKREGNAFIEKYITFLETGGSKSGREMMQALGVDPYDETFWQSGYEYIKGEIKELEGLLK